MTIEELYLLNYEELKEVVKNDTERKITNDRRKVRQNK